MQKMRLRILSWNIWIEGNFDEMKQLFQDANADIIGLQEVKDDDAARPVLKYLESIGYASVFMPVEKSWSGNVYRDGPAVLTKMPITSSETCNLSRENNRGAIRADLHAPSGTLHVISTHLMHTHQKQSDTQDEQIESLIQFTPTGRVIVMGDFNATPESSVIKRMSSVFDNTDPSNEPTWSMYPAGCPTCNPQSIDTRLDYIFVSKDLQADRPQVLRSPASDHLPIFAEVEV